MAKTDKYVKAVVPILNRPIGEAEEYLAEKWCRLSERHQKLLKLEKRLEKLEKSHKILVSEAQHCDKQLGDEFLAIKKQRAEIMNERHALNEDRIHLVQEGMVFTSRVTKAFRTRKEVINDYVRKLKAVPIDAPKEHDDAISDCEMVDPWNLPTGFVPTDTEHEYLYCFMDPLRPSMQPIFIPTNLVRFIERPGVIIYP